MDRTSKTIFAAIATGLWVNAAAQFVKPAIAQDADQSFLRTELTIIAMDVGLIESGRCGNAKLC
ncbi:MAG: hypothetical protein ACREHV_02045 [Rhizomicrobium sp.]